MLDESLPIQYPSIVTFDSLEPGNALNDVLKWDGNNWVSDGLAAEAVSSITGTADQIIASASTGDITLSLPQSIGITDAVQFGGVTTDDIKTDTITINNLASHGILRTNETGSVSHIIIGDGLTYIPGSGTLSASGGISGGGISSNNAVTRWDGAMGTTIKNSTITLSDAGVFSDLDSAYKVNTVNGFYQNTERVVWVNNDNNVAVGQNTLTSVSTGANNTAIGYDALSACTIGDSNTAVGANALKNVTEGGINIAIGIDSLLTTIDGSNNVAVGAEALKSLTNGTNNIAIGNQAGINSVSSGSNNILIGYNTRLFEDYSNCIVIGNNSTVAYASGSFVIDQIHMRNVSASHALYYNTSTSEVTYDLVSAPITNRIIHVMDTGNDETAVVYNIAKPYATLIAAANAAVSGDFIVVYPGSYSTTGGLARSGVNWYFHHEANVTMQDDEVVNTIFYIDFNLGGNVYGYANFMYLGVSHKYLCDKASDITITMECNSCTLLTTRIIIESPNTELRLIAHQFLNGADYSVAVSNDIACNWYIECPNITCASAADPTIYVRGSSAFIKFMRLTNTGGIHAYENGGVGSIDNLYGKYCSYLCPGKNSNINVSTVDIIFLNDGNAVFNGRCGELTAISGSFQGGIVNVINSTTAGVGVMLTVKTTLGNTTTDCNIGSAIGDGTGFYDFELYSEIGDINIKPIAIAQGASGRTNVKLLGEWSDKQYIFTVSSGTLEVAGHYISNSTLADAPFQLQGTGKLLLTGRIDIKTPNYSFPAVEAINGTTFISNKGVIVITDLSCIPIRAIDASINCKILAGGFSTNYTASAISSTTLIRARYDIVTEFESASLYINNTNIGVSASTLTAMAAQFVTAINNDLSGVMTASQDNVGIDTYFYVTVNSADIDYATSSIVNLSETYITSRNSYPWVNITDGLVIQDANVE